MSVKDSTFRGVRVSAKWATVLRAAWSDGVRFQLNSGRRTLTEQWLLWRNWQRFRKILAAFPNPDAPHIQEGRAAHALDVDTTDGGNARLASWLKKHGAHPTFPVRGEPWHLVISEDDLVKLHRKVVAK